VDQQLTASHCIPSKEHIENECKVKVMEAAMVVIVR
jgi:hypothetical protein